MLLHDIYVRCDVVQQPQVVNRFRVHYKPFGNKQTANNAIALPPHPGKESEKPLIFEIKIFRLFCKQTPKK